jgi:hypothetical protein
MLMLGGVVFYKEQLSRLEICGAVVAATFHSQVLRPLDLCWRGCCYSRICIDRSWQIKGCLIYK